MSGFAPGQDIQRAPIEEIIERFELLDEDGLPLPVGELPSRRALGGELEPEAVVAAEGWLGRSETRRFLAITP